MDSARKKKKKKKNKQTGKEWSMWQRGLQIAFFILLS